MNDREIRERLRGFARVWQRVRGESAGEETQLGPLMPRRRQPEGRGCRRPGCCPRKPR